MKLFDKTMTVLERALDARLAHQNVLAGNLANVDTPGYRPREIDFTAAMTTAQQDVSSVEAPRAPVVTMGEAVAEAPPARNDLTAAITNGQGSAAGLDGNAVDLDRTMVAMAENAIQYGAAARAAAKKLAILRYVASDGNG